MARHGENIRKRIDGRWEARYKVFDTRKGREVYRSVYGHTYDEVKEKKSAARRNVEKNMLSEKSDLMKSRKSSCQAVSFSQAANKWLDEIAGKKKPSTYVKYATVYKTHLARSLGSCILSDDINQEIRKKISEYLSRDALSESLKDSIFCVANQILVFANKKYGVCVPAIKKPAVKYRRKPIETLSKADQSKILSHIYSKPDKFTIGLLLCLYTGLRLGELCALKWTDFDFENMTLTVSRTVQRISIKGFATKTILMTTDPKSESSKRIIPLTVEIAKLIAGFKGDQTYVFGGGKVLEPRTMQYRFKKMLKEAGVDNKNFHILRHTFATNCIENSMDVKVLSEILGHSDVKITLNRYVHPTLDLKKKQIGLLPDFYGQICGQVA